MADHGVGDAPHEGPPNAAQSSAPNHYQVSVQLVAKPNDLRARPPEREVRACDRAPLGLYPLYLLT